MKKITSIIVLLLITFTLFSQGTKKNSNIYELSSKLDGMFLQSYEDITYFTIELNANKHYLLACENAEAIEVKADSITYTINNNIVDIKTEKKTTLRVRLITKEKSKSVVVLHYLGLNTEN